MGPRAPTDNEKMVADNNAHRVELQSLATAICSAAGAVGDDLAMHTLSFALLLAAAPSAVTVDTWRVQDEAIVTLHEGGACTAKRGKKCSWSADNRSGVTVVLAPLSHSMESMLRMQYAADGSVGVDGLDGPCTAAEVQSLIAATLETDAAHSTLWFEGPAEALEHMLRAVRALPASADAVAIQLVVNPPPPPLRKAAARFVATSPPATGPATLRASWGEGAAALRFFSDHTCSVAGARTCAWDERGHVLLNEKPNEVPTDSAVMFHVLQKGAQLILNGEPARLDDVPARIASTKDNSLVNYVIQHDASERARVAKLVAACARGGASFVSIASPEGSHFPD